MRHSHVESPAIKHAEGTRLTSSIAPHRRFWNWSGAVPFVIIVGLCVVTFSIYSPGLYGPFLLDDLSNLSQIGALGPIESWELFRAYLASGEAGPTGRPLALTSFLIDARDWPADPAAFKRTNLVLHCLIGLFLFMTLRSLLRAVGRTAREAEVIALIAAALWLMNPFLVSTTLYAVQRMTQLAALFVVLGFWGYLLGRSWLPTNPRLGYLLMSTSVVLASLLAVLSKENGILLPLLVLVTEFALRYHWAGPAPDWRWRGAFLWLPSAAILGYLAMRLPGMDQTIPARGFSVLERLLTQPQILWDYLFHLFVPHIQTQGLYRDDIAAAQGLLSPPSTLIALLGLAALVVAAVLARRRAPLLSLAILFFLSAHLLESSVIPLELYYEHRNYLPALFLFLPVAAGVLVLQRRFSPVIAPLVVVALVGSFTLATWQRATLWGDEELLYTVWAENNPHSARAQISYFQLVIARGEYSYGIARLRAAMDENLDSSVLTGVYLTNRVARGQIDAEEFREITARMQMQRFDRQQPRALQLLVNALNADATTPEHTEIMLEFLYAWRADWGGIRVVREQAPYLQGVLLSGQGEPDRALERFLEALQQINTAESGLNMASVLAGHGHHAHALVLLDATDDVLAKLPDGALHQSHSRLQYEIERLHGLISEDMEGRSDVETPVLPEQQT
jgi:protein O-mannosyl-transferase